MPRRQDIKSICILGSGPVIIGQAAEFDYSGSQAIKALKQDGFRIILINSNPASVMTGKNMAHRTYIEPMSIDYVSRILRKERPCALLPTVGGQTALNLACMLHHEGILKELSIELIGADINAIEKAENRELFKATMSKASLPVLPSIICHNLNEAKEALKALHFPLVIRPSFTLGGSGGGIAYNEEDFLALVTMGLEQSPTKQILLEKSVLGHKEFEFEVIRDEADNALVVCSIENFDPMGVHTGDSITIAPAQTLSDVEYQKLRNASLQVLRAIGVKTGGSNVQFSVDPKSGSFYVIEMNPRVSRSSALASKATGYPIAKVAALLSVGYHLHEIKNDITNKTSAAFEPSLDYVVVKMPKFAFEKFDGQETTLTTQMRSVGEVMSIGRSFSEALHKAMASLEDHGLGFAIDINSNDINKDNYWLDNLKNPSPKRLWYVAESFRHGLSIDDVAIMSSIDPWFLSKIKEIIDEENKISCMTLTSITKADLSHIKKLGFLDARIAKLIKVSEKDIRDKRKNLGILPLFKRIDSCAGEFLALTPYLYSTYEDPFYIYNNGCLEENIACEARPSKKKKIAILGSGPIRIGQGIEFDCCTTECIKALQELGYETIMINCNPETVSTDIDNTDRLYFEPLSFEHVMNILEKEKIHGVILQMGGQTPLSLAKALDEAKVPILGTHPLNIDQAEDRKLCKDMLASLGLRQPLSYVANNIEEGLKIASLLSYPIMVRPSYVLGGQAMNRVYHKNDLIVALTKAFNASLHNTVLLDKFLDGAIEIDVDALYDGTSIYIAGILQHIEEAGIHSGDSACVLPPYSINNNHIDEIKAYTLAIASKLNIKGLINIQFAIKDNLLYVLEVNPRASRTIPFISKFTGINISEIAAHIMCDHKLPHDLRDNDFRSFLPKNMVAIKSPVMPFIKFPKADPLLGPQMRSTGEVMSTANCLSWALLKSYKAIGINIPYHGGLLVSIADKDKEALLPAIIKLYEAGFNIKATMGTYWFLKAHGMLAEKVNKVREGSPHVLDLINNGDINIMFNTVLGSTSVYDSHLFRKTAILKNIPYFTSISAMHVLSDAITKAKDDHLQSIICLQDMHEYRG